MSPDTVTEALVFLAKEGYRDALEVLPDASRIDDEGAPTIDHTFRFEGPTDPSDAAIVIGVSWPASGRKAVVVSAYGPTADSEEAALLTALAVHRRRLQS